MPDKSERRLSERRPSARHYQGNPQKNSPSLGATLAFLGVDGMLALLHGSQGCSTFIRLQISRHFKESIPLNSTAMTEEDVIFGGWEQLRKGIATTIEKFRPKIVGVMSSGLSETMGDDMAAALRALRTERPELASVPVVTVNTPDYIGSMQEGYQRAVTAILAALLPAGQGKIEAGVGGVGGVAKSEGISETRVRPVVALLPGCHLTPADVEELKEIVSLFGLQPLVLPDLSTSMDGHLEAEPLPLVQGGTLLEDIKRLQQAKAVLSFGGSMGQPGDYLEEKHGIAHYRFPSLTGLVATDDFLLTLASLSGRPLPEQLLVQRNRLLDTLADYHDQLARKRVALALESDLLYSLSSALLEAGAEIPLALAATPEGGKEFPKTIPFRVGDLEDLEESGEAFNLIIANSNGRQAAKSLNCPHLRAGLPVFDWAGYPQKVWIGYRGSQNFLFDILNAGTG